MAWPQVVLFVATLVIGYVLRPKIPDPRPGGLQDIKAPTAEAGRPIPVLFGTRDISNPNVVWYGDLITRAVRK